MGAGKDNLKKGKTTNYLVMSADRHVFNLLIMLGLLFLTLYLFGTSLPGWFVIDEYVNTSKCATAQIFVSDHVHGSNHSEYSGLFVSSSLWYLQVRLTSGVTSTTKFLPFVILSRSDGESSHVLCSGILGLIVFTLLSLGIVFTMSASTKPSKMIYYGLSQVTIVTAASTWMLVSFEASQSYVTSVAREFCLEYVILSTSLSLQILTGACAVLAFIMGCILIHLATVISSNVKNGGYLRANEEISHTDEESDDEKLLIV